VSDNIVIWKYKSVKSACVLDRFEGLPESFRLPQGVPLQEGFPSGVRFHMDPDFPNNLFLPDTLLNSDQCIIASGRLTKTLREIGGPSVEYLAADIIDHKGRIASSEYSIVHPIAPLDCLDRAKSKVKESKILPGKIDSVKRLVLDETRIPPDRQIFRIQGLWSLILVRPSLADALDAGKFTSLEWLPVSDYPQT